MLFHLILEDRSTNEIFKKPNYAASLRCTSAYVCTFLCVFAHGSSYCFDPIKQGKTHPELNNHRNLLFNISEKSTGIVGFKHGLIRAP